MAVRLIVVEESAAGRMLIAARLAAGHHDARALDLAGFEAEAPDLQADLAVIGPSFADLAGTVARVKSRLPAGVPILCLSECRTPDARLAAMQAGARDVLAYPLPDELLLAVIRSLRRETETSLEEGRRRTAALRFGLAEAAEPFRRPARVAFVKAEGEAVNTTGIVGRSDWECLEIAPKDVLSSREGAPTADAYVMSWAPSPARSEWRGLLPEIRSRDRTRHAAVMVACAEGDFDAAIQALDKGANDILPAGARPEEVRLRIERMLASKFAADALRRTRETSMRLAVTDSLTGLYNRRYVQAYLDDLASKSENGAPLTVMMADLDHFKSVNDRYGHNAGDQVLREIASRLRDNLRSVDLVARYGGEEFLILMPHATPAEAGPAAERLRTRIGADPVPIGAGRSVRVTVSIGVTVGDAASLQPMPERGFVSRTQKGPLPLSFGDLLCQADKALFQAKALGRNRVQVASMAR